MTTTDDFSGFRCTPSASAIVLADGSMESTVLAFFVASHLAHQEGAHLTLLSLPLSSLEGHVDPPAWSVVQMFEHLKRQYPTVSLDYWQLSGAASASRFLFDQQHFGVNIARFLLIVKMAPRYGRQLFLPLYQEALTLRSGGVSVEEIIKSTNELVESLVAQPVQVIAPFLAKTVQEIVRVGRELGVNLDATFDCEESDGYHACEICRRCIYRFHALHPDPPIVSAGISW